MKTHIGIDIDTDSNEMTVCEENCTELTYEISEVWPIIIYDICKNLQNYLMYEDWEIE